MLILQEADLRLLPLSIDHFDALLQIAAECPDTCQYTPNSALGAENMHSYIQTALVQRAAGRHLPFVVEYQGRIVGSTRFYHIDEHHKSVHIGYTWLHTDTRGSNVNKRTKYLLLQHAFEHWDMCRVAFTADINNHASIRALESIGATQEGVLRSDMVLASGVRRNTAVFGILQHEWRTRIKAMLAGKIAAGNPAEAAPAPGLWQKIRRSFRRKP